MNNVKITQMSRIRLNNLKTSLRFPCLGLSPILDSINLSECATPVSPDNGSITYTGTYVGATAEQSCNTGYTLKGVKVISCLADGLWSHPPVKCTLKGN